MESGPQMLLRRLFQMWRNVGHERDGHNQSHSNHGHHPLATHLEEQAQCHARIQQDDNRRDLE